ncbi:MAG TPA: hypothetical protein VGP93_11395 [Polyangiaceae bacterium]|nr:hypothetical protein [Polyangiaceae bacterium]
MAHHRAPPALYAALAALLALCCKPGPGSSCDKGDARCVDDKRELVCENEKYIEVPCRGRAGCAQQGEAVSCDISGNRAGDRCSSDEQGTAVCLDGQTLLSCRAGKFVTLPCRGQNGCERDGDHSRCDRSIAAAGDSCDEEGSKACAEDSRQVLGCHAGKMAPVLLCRGERGCLATGSKLDCDLSVALEQDSCDGKLEGHVACTPDAAAIVRCRNNRFVLDEKCKAGRRCQTSGTSTECALSK